MPSPPVVSQSRPLSGCRFEAAVFPDPIKIADYQPRRHFRLLPNLGKFVLVPMPPAHLLSHTKLRAEE